MNSGKIFLALGALAGMSGVILGAFAAHGLKDTLAPDRIEIFIKGAEYQMYHCFALVAIGILSLTAGKNKFLNISGWFFTIGILLFSGSLYLYSLTLTHFLVFFTPAGGLFFILGWLFLLIFSLRRKTQA